LPSKAILEAGGQAGNFPGPGVFVPFGPGLGKERVFTDLKERLVAFGSFSLENQAFWEKKMPQDFLSALNERILVCDGGMGTALYARGVPINKCFDELNLSQPHLVREIHRSYLSAGADVLETNTFLCNRYKLRPHGLEEKLEEIAQAGVALAREEARGAAWVAGSIGPLGLEIEPYGRLSEKKAEEAFRQVAGALISAGADLLILETFGRVEELLVALRAAQKERERAGRKVPIVVQVTCDEDARTLGGTPVEIAAQRLQDAGADVIGANCGIGPRPMLTVIQKMAQVVTRPLSAQPNAGRPEEVDGRLMYVTTPEYFLTYAKRFIRTGVRLLGGCCGTGPEHIKALRRTVQALSPGKVEVKPKKAEEGQKPKKIVPTAEKTPFAAKIAAGRFVTSVEILPPRGNNPEKVLRAAALLKEAGIDAVNIPDGPRASARMSPLALALLFQQKVGIETILHYTCRDRNLLGMQSDLLGAHALGIRNILAVTGDPPKLGNYPDATAVYDVDSIGLVKLIRNLNQGLDVAGNPLGEPCSLHIGVGANPGALNREEEIRRFKLKVESGAEFCFTQPVFDRSLFERFLEAIRHYRIPILAGILPIPNARVAEFLHNEVPGMQLPERIRRAIHEAEEKGCAREVGIELAQEALLEVKELVEGAYVMSPAGGAKTALEVLRVLPA